MKKAPAKRRVLRLAACAAAAAVLFLLIASRHRPPAETRQIKSNEDRVAYLAALGWQVEPTPFSRQTVRLPRSFPAVLTQYNELQRAQGFDMSRYAGKSLELYVYTVQSPPGQEERYACLYLYKNRVVGGDVHSAAMTGFMTGLLPAENG